MQRMGGPMGRGFMTEEEKKNRPKVTKELLFRVFSYLRPYWKQFLLILVCIAFSSLLALYPNVLTGRIVDALAEKQGVDILIRLILLSLGGDHWQQPDRRGAELPEQLDRAAHHV